MILFKKWEIVIVEFGTTEYNLKDEFYQKDKIVNELYGVNLGKEFSEKHYAVIISPSYLNKYKVVVLPISSKSFF